MTGKRVNGLRALSDSHAEQHKQSNMLTLSRAKKMLATSLLFPRAKAITARATSLHCGEPKERKVGRNGAAQEKGKQ
jgi:hypothetical protein